MDPSKAILLKDLYERQYSSFKRWIDHGHKLRTNLIDFLQAISESDLKIISKLKVSDNVTVDVLGTKVGYVFSFIPDPAVTVHTGIEAPYGIRLESFLIQIDASGIEQLLEPPFGKWEFDHVGNIYTDISKRHTVYSNWTADTFMSECFRITMEVLSVRASNGSLRLRI